MSDLSKLASCVHAEDDGLVTIFVDLEALAAVAKTLRGVRLRLTPPPERCSEDGRVYNIPAAYSHIEKVLLDPLRKQFDGLVITDVVTGLRRFSLGLRHLQHKQLAAAIEKIAYVPGALDDPHVWLPESVTVVDEPVGQREQELVDLIKASQRPAPPAPDSVTKLAQRIATLEKPGSFEKRATLDEQYVDPKRLDAALVWLDSQLGKLNTNVDARIRLAINTHPRSTTFQFLLGDNFYAELDRAVADWIDAPSPNVRRASYLLWCADKDVYAREFENVAISVEP